MAFFASGSCRNFINANTFTFDSFTYFFTTFPSFPFTFFILLNSTLFLSILILPSTLPNYSRNSNSPFSVVDSGKFPMNTLFWSVSPRAAFRRSLLRPGSSRTSSRRRSFLRDISFLRNLLSTFSKSISTWYLRVLKPKEITLPVIIGTGSYLSIFSLFIIVPAFEPRSTKQTPFLESIIKAAWCLDIDICAIYMSLIGKQPIV